MSRRNKRRILLLIAIVVGVAVLGPALFGEPREQNGGDPWRNFVFDFQTLLTGIFAVGAATWTVLTMELTDTRSEERHRQLMAVSLRSELRAVDRALNPQADEIEEILGYLWSADYDPLETGVNNWEWFSNLAKTNYGSIRDLEGIVERPQITDAQPYFDGDLLMAFDEFTGYLVGVSNDLREHILALHSAKNEEWGEFGVYRHEWEGAELLTCNRAVLMVRSGNRLVSAMKRTRTEYAKLKTRFSV